MDGENDPRTILHNLRVMLDAEEIGTARGRGDRCSETSCRAVNGLIAGAKHGGTVQPEEYFSRPLLSRNL